MKKLTLLLENIIICIITAFWFSSVPVAFLTLARFLKNRGVFVENHPTRIPNDPKIVFQIKTFSRKKFCFCIHTYGRWFTTGYTDMGRYRKWQYYRKYCRR